MAHNSAMKTTKAPGKSVQASKTVKGSDDGVGDEDIDKTISAFEKAIIDMRADGFSF